jgi:hypothetical protein
MLNRNTKNPDKKAIILSITILIKTLAKENPLPGKKGVYPNCFE